MARPSSTAPKLKSNATRLKWPPVRPDPSTGRFDPEYVAYLRDLELCRSLVVMGSGILRRDLELIIGGPDQGIVRAATDGKKIWLPKMHPRRRVAVKHELAHLYFLSDIELRLAFVQALIKELEGLMGAPFAPQAVERLTGDLCFFINILDDVRVNSLWGVLYPGDGADMDEWYFGLVGPDMMAKARVQHGDDVDDLFTFAILLCLHQNPDSEYWGEFKNDIIQARDRVMFTAFPAALAITRDLVLRIARKVAERMKATPVWGGGSVGADPDIDATIKARLDGQALRQALLRLVTGKPHGANFVDHNAGFDIQNPDGSAPSQQPGASALDKAARLLRVLAEDDLDAYLAQQEEQGLGTVQRVQRALTALPATGQFRSQADYLQRSLPVELKLHTVDRGSLAQRLMSAEDRHAVAHWKTRLQRVFGAKRVRLEESGNEFSSEAYIQQRLSRVPLEPFYRDVPGRGFDVALLVDMSGSMASAFDEVERLALGLYAAMDFSMVSIDVLGFKQIEAGRVDIILFPNRPPGLRGTAVNVGGATPLSHAITVATQRLKRRQNSKSIFLISDGKPYFHLKDTKSTLSEQTLMAWTKESVEAAHAQHVQVYTFMLGDDVPSDAEMSFMFGDFRWRKMDKEDLFKEGFDLITQEFLRFVRTR